LLAVQALIRRIATRLHPPPRDALKASSSPERVSNGFPVPVEADPYRQATRRVGSDAARLQRLRFWSPLSP